MVFFYNQVSTKHGSNKWFPGKACFALLYWVIYCTSLPVMFEGSIDVLLVMSVAVTTTELK